MRRAITTTIMMAGLCSGLLFAADRPAARQRNQQKRIAEGVESGEINKREARRLEAKEAKLHREIRRDRKDGGGLTATEKAKIEAKQDALSADIARQKHDNQKQKAKQ